MALSSDGRWIAGSEDSNVVIIDRETRPRYRSFHGHSAAVRGMAFSPTSDVLVSTAHSSERNDEAKVWDVSSVERSTQVYEGLDRDVCGVDVDATGSRIVGASRGGQIAIWETGDPKPRVHADVGRGVLGIDLSPNGERIAVVGRDRDVVYLDGRSGERVGTSGAIAEGYLDSVRYFPAGDRVVAGPDANARVFLLPLASAGRMLSVLSASRNGRVEVSPDGKRFAVMGVSGRLQIWNTRTGELIRDLVTAPLGGTRAAWSPDGARIVTGANAAGNAIVRVWRTDTFLCEHVLRGHDHHVPGITFGPGGRLFTAGHSSAIVWDAASGTELLSLRFETSGLTRDLRISADGRVLVVGGKTIGVQAWVVAPGQRSDGR